MNTGAPWYYDPFVIPFYVGFAWLVGVVLWKWIQWWVALPVQDKRLVKRGVFSNRSLKAVRECVFESLLHRRIWKINPVLGYMHTSLALGWFLLIVVGKFETSAYLHNPVNPPHIHVFFRYFFPEEPHLFVRNFNYAFLMDALLVFTLSGVLLAWVKRTKSRLMGMRHTTRHTPFDRMALGALWFIFPLRWLAESVTCGLNATGSFFTGKTGVWLDQIVPFEVLWEAEWPLWGAYSLALGVFFMAMPYSRYMHIFTEIPLIFLRQYRLRARAEGSSFDRFQIEACSRCGICLDPCPIASEVGVTDIQAAYFLRDRRYKHLTQRVMDTCLMCGRCTAACPVGIEVDTLRLNSRVQAARQGAFYNARRYTRTEDRSEGRGRVGFFAGCMGQLTPTVTQAMGRIFAAAGVEVWWADRAGGVCCGRPMRLSGNLPAAAQLESLNTELFHRHGITTLVTGCPICYQSFTQEYGDLAGIRVLHHSQYLAELIAGGRLRLKAQRTAYAFHDPCELRGIYSEPRYVLEQAGRLTNSEATERDRTHCCGGSLANLTLDSTDQMKIGAKAVGKLLQTNPDILVSSCPQCKKSLQRAAANLSIPVMDLAEAVARAI